MIVGIDINLFGSNLPFEKSAITGLLRRNFELHTYTAAAYVLVQEVPEGIRSLPASKPWGEVDILIGPYHSTKIQRHRLRKQAIVIGSHEEAADLTNLQFATHWWDIYTMLCRMQILDKSWLK